VLFEDSFNYLSKMCLLRMRRAAVRMLAMARARGCTTVVAGSDASDDPELYLQAGADHVVIGEGELTLAELVAACSSGGRPAPGEIDGLCFRGGEGVVRTRPRRPIRDLDALPLPAWDLVDVAAYRRLWRSRHGYHSMNVVTTRGCPYHCNWCAKPIYGQRYSVRSPEGVARELRWLKQAYGPDHVSFADDIFGLRPGWIEAFADAVEAHEARLPFKCLSRADLLGEAAVAALARSGCRTVWIGAESGSQRILDAMEKGIRVEQVEAACARLRRAGIEVGFFLQFGYPGETREDIERTLELVRRCEPDDIGISVSYPLPGTRFHERVRRELGARRNWTDSGDLAMLYAGPYPTAFYRSLHRVVHKEFRLRRARRMRGPGADAPTRARRARRRLSLAYHALTLPLEKLRLECLARAPHAGAAALAPALTRERAARPTEQD
jgi:anaerobic magnesium-protoporphyrin IX monomethyl ester cyclase